MSSIALVTGGNRGIGLAIAHSLKAAGHDVVVAKHQFRANSRAMILGETDGLVKVIAKKNRDGSAGQVLGVHMVGPWVTEQLAAGYLAVNWEASVDEIAEFIMPHPSLSELFGETVISLTGRSNTTTLHSGHEQSSIAQARHSHQPPVLLCSVLFCSIRVDLNLSYHRSPIAPCIARFHFSSCSHWRIPAQQPAHSPPYSFSKSQGSLPNLAGSH